MHETLIKRTIWVVQCDCDPVDKFRKIWDNDPPKSFMCPKCSKWHDPIEESYIGKDKFTQ